MDMPPWTGFNFTKTLHNKPRGPLDPTSLSLTTPFVACITGANKGIGAATAKVFVQAGASGLVLTARSESSLSDTIKSCKDSATNPDIKITAVEVAIGDEESTKALAEVVKKEHGRLDLLINNAGFVSTDSSAFDRIDSIRTDQISEVLNVCYIGRFLTSKYLLPILLSSPNGAKAIVNISSIGGFLSNAGALGFSTSALATNKLTESTAARYADDGIVAYAVHPGMVATGRPPGMAEWVFENSKDEPELCGAFIVWLVKETRPWLSGRYLSVTWDVEELEAKKQEIVERDMLKMRLVV